MKLALTDIPLGYRKVEIGLELRQALWKNGNLHNSEVWQELTEEDKKELNKIYHAIFKKKLQACIPRPQQNNCTLKLHHYPLHTLLQLGGWFTHRRY